MGCKHPPFTPTGAPLTNNIRLLAVSVTVFQTNTNTDGIFFCILAYSVHQAVTFLLEQTVPQARNRLYV